MSLSSTSVNRQNTSFSHPIEATFARILDFYGLEWEYEPRSFPLRWDEQGNVLEAFSPDFYLPQQNLYIELTTLKPELMTQKNRKVRRLKELHPEINVKLLKRKNLHDLMVKFGLFEEAEKIQGNRSQTANR